MNTDPFGVCLEPKCNDVEPSKELPSFKDMTTGFINTAKDVLTGAVQGGGMIVTEKIYNERMSICNTCEFLRKEDKRCTQCGCFMEAKSRFKKAYCPVHKWEMVE